MMWANLGVLGIGGLLVAVPVVLHFLMQPKPVEVTFPALRFLKQKQQSTRSRMRVRHLLLLLMRCLVIALLAAALAGPSVASTTYGNWLWLGGIGLSGALVATIACLAYLHQPRNWTLIGILAALVLGHLLLGGISAIQLMQADTAQLMGDSQEPIAALIVIDTSPRMDLQSENQTRLEKAREFAQWLLTQFPADSQICISATDGDRPFFSVDVAAAERRIDKLQSNFSGIGVPETLLDGIDILKDAPQERKEIYLISDLTQAAWSGEGTSELTRQLKRYEEFGLFVIDVGVASPRNFMLGELSLSAAEISPGGRLTVFTDARRIGPAERRTVQMSIEKIDPSRPAVLDGKTLFPESSYPPQLANLDIRENSTMPVKFTMAQTLDLGTYHGSLQIESQDGLAIDDRRFFTFRVSRTQKVLIVHPANVNPQVMLSLLAPQDEIENGTARYQCDVNDQRDLPVIAQFSDYDAVILLDPDPIAAEVWERLDQFVQAGGGLGIFLGHNASLKGDVDPRWTSDIARSVIGGQLEQQWFNEGDDLFLSPKELSHPIFRLIQGYEDSVLWNRFPVYKHWGLVPDTDNPDRPTQTLLRFGNREPAVIERSIGLGRVLTMTTPITEYGYTEGRQSWNLLLSGYPVPAYLLLTGMATHLVQTDADALNVEVGQMPVFKNDLREYPDTYLAYSPQADKPPTPLNSIEGKIRYRFNEAPGQYRFRGTQEETTVLRGFSSNLNPAATDLTRLKPDELDGILGADRFQLATQQNEIQRQQGTLRRGREFYPLIVLMLLVALGVEYLMSNRFYS